MLVRTLLVVVVAQASALNLATRTTQSSVPALGRRGALVGAAAAVVSQLPIPAFAASKQEEKAQATLRDASTALHKLLDQKDDFLKAYAEGKGDKFPVPSAVPFTTFQVLEKNAEPEFMEVAIDYSEAARGARDLIKLAKLTKQPVEVTIKEPGKPRKTEVTEYGAAEGAGLSTAKEYAERALQEFLAASICLDKAITVMVAK